jgi:hypothetical protein
LATKRRVDAARQRDIPVCIVRAEGGVDEVVD